MSVVDKVLDNLYGNKEPEKDQNIKEEWQLVGAKKDLKKLPCRRIYCSLGKPEDVAMYFVRGKFYVINATCPHLGGRLDKINDIEDLDLDPPIAVCPRHFYEFNLETGKCEQGLTVRTYEVKIDTNENVFVLHSGKLSLQPFDTEID